MTAWDRRTPEAQAKLRDARLRAQLRDGVAPFSPYWRERFAALRVPASTLRVAADLTKLPAVGERDVCPDGNPAGMAGLVLRADEAGFAIHTPGPDLRRALVRRVGGRAAYRRQVEAEIRPTTYHFAGRGFTFPVASTRGDLDLIARAGSRAWRVLGLRNSDVLVSAVPVASRLDHLFLSYAALAAGAPALFAGDDLAEVVRLVSPTVLAVRPADIDLLSALDLPSLRTVLLVGHPTAAERSAAAAAAGGADVLALYGPAEGRVMWAECRAGGAAQGFHTYPDLDLVELVEPESGEPAGAAGGELVVTQLGLRGTALLRWRTGDLIAGTVHTGGCPSCGRTVPRVPSAIGAGGLQPLLSLRGRAPVLVDLRAVAGALAGRTDLVDWQVEVNRSARTGGDELVVLVVPVGDETGTVVSVYRDVRSVAGVPPTQVVVVEGWELSARRDPRDTLAPRVSIHR